MSNRVVASALKLLITGTRENQVIVREVEAQPRDVETQGKELIQCDISTRGKSDPLKRGALPVWETKQERACDITQWEGEQNIGHST